MGVPSRVAMPKLGLKVPWGANFDVGIDIRGAMRRSKDLGVRILDHDREVRMVVSPRYVFSEGEKWHDDEHLQEAFRS